MLYELIAIAVGVAIVGNYVWWLFFSKDPVQPTEPDEEEQPPI